MWAIKLKLRDADNSLVVTRGVVMGVVTESGPNIWWWKTIWLWVVGAQCNIQTMSHRNVTINK